jgi:Fur family peroxide stress response transcriptional regulator
VLDYLAQSEVHATAEEIFHAINRRDSRGSRATDYNSLHSLAKAGLVREVISNGTAAGFDASLHPHHRFVCERCGAIEDIPWFDVLPAVGQTALGGRSVHNYDIVFRGSCIACTQPREPGVRS